jgi:hypothetical protein
MDKERGKEPQWRFKRQRASLCQKTRDELEAAATRRRVEARLFLRSNEWHEEEVNVGENGERPKLPD